MESLELRWVLGDERDMLDLTDGALNPSTAAADRSALLPLLAQHCLLPRLVGEGRAVAPADSQRGQPQSLLINDRNRQLHPAGRRPVPARAVSG
jgi:hypothetical protein